MYVSHLCGIKHLSFTINLTRVRLSRVVVVCRRLASSVRTPASQSTERFAQRLFEWLAPRHRALSNSAHLCHTSQLPITPPITLSTIIIIYYHYYYYYKIFVWHTLSAIQLNQRHWRMLNGEVNYIEMYIFKWCLKVSSKNNTEKWN